MQSKAKLQTVGTVASLILAFITLQVTNNILSIDLYNPSAFLVSYGKLLLPVITVIIMLITGASYFNSRIEYEGITRFLYLLVALAHIILAPLALLVGFMRIKFGQYWWAILAGIVILIYLSSHKIEGND